MSKAADHKRLNAETAVEDSHGRLFIDPGTHVLTDLSGVRLLRCGVDTVRQLYRGLIRPEVMALFEVPGAMVELLGRSGIQVALAATLVTSTSCKTPIWASSCW